MSKAAEDLAKLKLKLAKLAQSWDTRYIMPEELEPDKMALASATEKGLAIAAVELRKAINGDS